MNKTGCTYDGELQKGSYWSMKAENYALEAEGKFFLALKYIRKLNAYYAASRVLQRGSLFGEYMWYMISV